ncbi:MAG: Cys-tRNA(Pro) deacylase [Tissierellia bacterium]|nr:Cys-tRNA(Pro) deacylase [Tissierellia bacterium]
MSKKTKTNAMRILDSQKIDYDIYEYENDGKIDGISVAEKIGESKESVFKTLVLRGSSKEIYICMVPVANEIDMKKLGKILGEKSVMPVNPSELQKLTGYIRGGCSPIGMTKKYDTVLDISALDLDRIIVSGGKIGTQIKIKVEDLIRLTGAKLEEVKR